MRIFGVARASSRLSRIVALLGLAMPIAAFADTAVCTGKISTLGNHGNGLNGLSIAIGTNNMIRVCSFTATQFSVTAEDCRHLASIAAMAFAMDTNVVLYVDNAPSTACSAIPGWHVSNTRYFATEK
jgi:hypothetical protein